MTINNNFKKLNVSRETWDILKEYVRLLKKWNNSINLISRKSVSKLWERHILDSAQLTFFLKFGIKTWVDLGSGAGFPGLVIAILAKDEFSGMQMILIESDKRKCVFLSEVVRELDLKVRIISDRIEDCSHLNADIISARALAPMKKLLIYFDLHGKKNCKGLFLKGKNFQTELDECASFNNYEIKINSSLINNSGIVVEVRKKKEL